MEVTVIGAGLAGSEAALQLAKRNIKVNLYALDILIKLVGEREERYLRLGAAPLRYHFQGE